MLINTFWTQKVQGAKCIDQLASYLKSELVVFNILQIVLQNFEILVAIFKTNFGLLEL